MTAEREGLVEEIAGVLAEHEYAPVFGCECTPVDNETGVKDILDVPWEQHVADALADLLAARDRRVRAEAWDEGHRSHMPVAEFGDTPCFCANPYAEESTA